MTLGNRCGGRIDDRMVRMPFISPEAPKPAIARPTISMGEDWAAPHNAEPSSKIVKKTRNDH
jgi:hypothetical protein